MRRLTKFTTQTYANIV